MARGPGVARAAALLAALTFASQLLGFVRDAVIAAVYGAGAALDAYLVAQGVMNLVLALVAGAMARSIVPAVSRAVAAGDPSRAHRTTQVVLTLTLAVLVTGSAVMWLAAEQVVLVLAPGFDPATARLATSLTRIVLVATVFIAATDILAATTQAHGRFFHSGVQGVPFNLVMIGAALGFGAMLGAQALAIGFVVGSATRLLVQLPAVRASGLRLRPRVSRRGTDVAQVLRLAPPMLLSTAVVNVNTLVDRAVGSAQGEGVITALSFGWRLVTLVDSLLVVTVAAALYPTFSALHAPESRHELRSLVSRSTSIMLVVLAPATVLLMVAARPVVSLVFGHGDFDAEAVRSTAIAVVAYAVSATALGLRVIASRASFAVGDSRTPVVVAVVSMAVNVVGDLTLGVAYGVAGLAASTSLSLLLGAGLLMWLVARRHGALAPRPVAAAAARVGTAAVLAALAGVAVSSAAGGVLPGEAVLATLGRLSLIGAAVLTVYAATLVVLRSPELRELVQVVRSRLLRRRGA